MTIFPEGILYTKVKPDDVQEIVEKTLAGRELVDRLLYIDPGTGIRCHGTGTIPFYQRQQRFVLRDCGTIDPESLAEYESTGGYRAARKAMLEMTPEQICVEIAKSGLRGRGGGGFPTGRKWEAARAQKNAKKYVICNADEGDPGAFMNRSLMEGNPHSVLEGLIIAARAIGADETIVYVRTEYPLAVKRMRKAVEDVTNAGILGANAMGSGMPLRCEVMEGAGAFVCGEETAMIASIEGKRGMPAPKPPFPAQSGLWGKPTIINNVETLAHVVRIINDGADNFRKLGAANSPGTKTFALTGHVANTGLIEVPFGTTLREVVMNIGGGVTNDAGELTHECFKAVQIGGPSGGCLTEDHLELSLDFDSLRGVGAMVGSGGLVVVNKQTCMVSMARFFMEFTQRESCGKCVLCREGTKQMLALLDDILEGRATEHTLELLETLAKAVQKGSLCGLGKTAPNPVLSTLRYFRAEYDAHVHAKYCPAGRCKALKKPVINELKCKGCGLCLRKCAVGAITGEKKKPHKIDQEKCIKCGVCGTVCKFQAVE
ncbi:MAG TPA: NADH-ubiquinone oxidoreductase-F iron-sulfur binding region domain-containing protein [Tepidisphaeraceae bacterium]|nr:NADH-ubiquinone oxidoreductase-F iron-sulfur binding region domain-containing protein [Tepidisphaeraceae bacterium]